MLESTQAKQNVFEFEVTKCRLLRLLQCLFICIQAKGHSPLSSYYLRPRLPQASSAGTSSEACLHLISHLSSPLLLPFAGSSSPSSSSIYPQPTASKRNHNSGNFLSDPDHTQLVVKAKLSNLTFLHSHGHSLSQISTTVTP